MYKFAKAEQYMSTNQYAKTKIIMLLEVEENKVAGYKLYYRKTLCF